MSANSQIYASLVNNLKHFFLYPKEFWRNSTLKLFKMHDFKYPKYATFTSQQIITIPLSSKPCLSVHRLQIRQFQNEEILQRRRS
jgi:hypothetical protein